MPDSEKQYPSRRIVRSNGHQRSPNNEPTEADLQEPISRRSRGPISRRNEEIEEQEPISRHNRDSVSHDDQEELEEQEPISRRSRGPIRRRSQEELLAEDTAQEDLQRPVLPAHGLQYALLIGVVAGVLSAGLNIVITLINAPLFQNVARQGTNVAYGTAFSVVGLQCLSFCISLTMGFIGGYMVGKTAIQRRLGFYMGTVAGAIFYLGGFITQFIPNYPGNMASGAAGSVGAYAGSILVIVIFLLFFGLADGLLGLWGAARATRLHPYYAKRREAEEE